MIAAWKCHLCSSPDAQRNITISFFDLFFLNAAASSSLAVDGSTNCAATSSQGTSAWWRVTLDIETFVSSVSVSLPASTTDSTYMTKYITVRVGSDKIIGKNPLCSFISGGTSSQQSLSCNLIGKYVEVSMWLIKTVFVFKTDTLRISSLSWLGRLRFMYANSLVETCSLMQSCKLCSASSWFEIIWVWV